MRSTSPLPSRARGALLLALAGALAGRSAAAQELAVKRSAVRPQATACPVAPLPRQPGSEQRSDARQRAALAQEAAIVGNQRAAREQFARAAQLDPSNEEIAYQYGRTLEDTGSPAEALREYCRFITLAPASGDAADVRARIAALAPPTPSLGAADQATPQFRAGLASFDGARYEEAERAFGGAIAEAPTWPEAHYNRALARLAQRKSAPAVADLRRYLELKPDATDRVTVLNQVARIERPLPFTPGGALGRGIVPGLGQFYTRRPVFGVAVLAAAAGGVAYALQAKEELRQDSVPVTLINGQTIRQPTGLPYNVTVRPNAAAGVAIAAGVTAVAAVESYIYARRARAQVLSAGVRRTASVRVRPLPAWDRSAVGVALDVRVPVTLGGGTR
jgi:tetratricopeptide (TPR) repeat protein